MKRRSGFAVMGKLIGLVKPLTGYMVLAITMGLIGHLCASLITIFGGYAVLNVLGFETTLGLQVLFVSMAVFALLRAVLRYGEQACNHFIAFKLLALIRDKVFQALRRLCPAKLEGKDKGNLISVITSDIELLEVFYAHTISPAAIATLFSILMCLFMSQYHWSQGLLALTAYLVVGVAVPLVTSRLSGEDGMRFRTKSGNLSSFVLDSLRGLPEIQQYGQGKARLAEMNRRTEALAKDEERMKRTAGYNAACTNTVILVFDLAMLFVSAMLYQRHAVGFDGVLISDWAAIEEIIYHGYCADREEAAVRSVEAGVDIDMMTGIYCENLCRLVREGKISEDLIDESCMRILELKNKLGLFENAYKDADETKEKEVILCKEHRDLAREAARKSFVLLKNEEKILPLGKEKKIAWVGPYVHSRNLMGSWSFIGDAKDVTNLEEAVKAQADTTNMSFHAGSPMLGSDIRLEGFGEAMEQSHTPEEEETMLLEAVNAAKEADVVVLAIGEDRLQSGEATSNANIRIPEIQQRLLERVSKVNENVVVVLFNGRPLDLRDVVSKAKAVLEVWMPGTEGANAIADVVFGAYAPSGKLTMSFPYSVGQVPVHYNEYSTGRPHVPGKDKDRFRSKYLDIPNAPLFPFGYGLGYTSFEISDVTLDKTELGMENEIKASVTVKNTGDTAGTETVQLYIHDVAASVVRPVKKLKDFRKVTLRPGEEQKVEFTINEKELRFLTENERVESENGVFEVFVGSDSTTENKAEFVLKK